MINQFNLKSIKQQGVSLVELLIATVIFSAGLLVLIAIQGKAFQLSNESYFRTQAAILADGIVETLAAQTDTVFTVDASGTTTVDTDRIKQSYINVAWSTAASWSSNCDNAAVTCNWNETVAYNADLIKQRVANTLPNGQINLFDCRGSADYGFCLALSWQEKSVTECNGVETVTGGVTESEDKCFIQYIGL